MPPRKRAGVSTAEDRDVRLGLPTFFPEATRASVQSVGTDDLRHIGVQSLMVNTFHLLRRPGMRAIQRSGGVHRFMDWDRTIMSDSGGFQVYSLIRQNPAYGTIRPNEVIFRDPDTREKWHFSPARSIQLQFQLGADIMVCLDDCTDDTASASEQEASVDRTIRWAGRCKEEFDRLSAALPAERPKPRLLAVVQGGPSVSLRRHCAGELVNIGFDGYGFGGWPLSSDGELHRDQLAAVAESVPIATIRHALGVGRPDHVVTAVGLGYNAFDCSLPTRDARRGRLYVYQDGYPDSTPQPGQPFYENLHILDERHHSDNAPIDAGCDCPCCTRYSRAYVQHLLKIGDATGERLASVHNLRFYVRLTDSLRAAA